MSHEESNQTDAVPTSLTAFASSIAHYTDQTWTHRTMAWLKYSTKLCRLKGNGSNTDWERHKKGLTSSLRLLTRSTPLPECPDRATRPAAAAAAAAALKGLSAPAVTQKSSEGVQPTATLLHQNCFASGINGMFFKPWLDDKLGI